MAPGLRRERTGQVAVDSRVEGARDVPCRKGLCAPLRTGQIETAVDDHPVARGEVGGESCGRNERIWHGRIFGAAGLSLQSPPTPREATMVIEVCWVHA